MSPLLSIASADSVDWYTSDSEICVYSFSDDDAPVVSPTHTCWWSDIDSDTCFYAYLDVADVPTYVMNWYSCNDNYNAVLMSSSPMSLWIQFRDDSLYFYSDSDAQESVSKSWKIYISASPITYSPSAWGSDSVFPEITVPSSFTSWLTQLVENFGGTIANWIPSVLLIALWITAIFALFRVVRWYAKSAFKW